MNELLDQVQDSDPEFARTIRRLRWASRGLAAAIVVALGAGLWAVIVNSRQGDQITQIQRSPCTSHPAGAACARIRQRVARAEPISNPCISYQRVTGRRGRECPRMLVRETGRGAPPGAPAGREPPPSPAAAPAGAITPEAHHQVPALAPAAADGSEGQGPAVPHPGGPAPPPASSPAPVSSTPAAPVSPASPASAPPQVPPPSQEPEALVPAVLDPVLEAVCSIADLVAGLCG
ncbi:MAG TPA: hypothetical protein VFJ57_01355 [Solirubrobacterales bacterium]|nr:hypothetical protein [Solirubrobacterales bacterium]